MPANLKRQQETARGRETVEKETNELPKRDRDLLLPLLLSCLVTEGKRRKSVPRIVFSLAYYGGLFRRRCYARHKENRGKRKSVKRKRDAREEPLNDR